MISLKIILLEIKHAPERYLPEKDVLYLKAYLDGFELACINYLESDKITDLDFLKKLYIFLKKKYLVKTTHNWAGILRINTQTKEDAYKIFFELVDNHWDDIMRIDT